jgi:hypothetical protein
MSKSILFIFRFNLLNILLMNNQKRIQRPSSFNSLLIIILILLQLFLISTYQYTILYLSITPKPFYNRITILSRSMIRCNHLQEHPQPILLLRLLHTLLNHSKVISPLLSNITIIFQHIHLLNKSILLIIVIFISHNLSKRILLVNEYTMTMQKRMLKIYQIISSLKSTLISHLQSFTLYLCPVSHLPQSHSIHLNTHTLLY